jgi:hypothetical protein
MLSAGCAVLNFQTSLQIVADDISSFGITLTIVTHVVPAGRLDAPSRAQKDCAHDLVAGRLKSI